MANSTVKFTWCSCHNYKIQSKDTHDKCLLCLGIQHAKEAVLEYGKCPHCAKMDWSTCIKRLTKVQEVIHQEAQQRKNLAAQTGIQAKPQTAIPSATVKETPSVEVASGAASTSQNETTAPASCSSALPIMFTLLTPSPGLSDPNGMVVKGAYVSHVGLQHAPDPASATEHAKPPLPLPSASHERSHSSRCRPCCRRNALRGCRRKRKRSPVSSSPSSWSSSESLSETVKMEKKASRKAAKSGRLLEMVRQKLEAQQEALEMRWSVMEKRLEFLEKRTSADVGACVCANSAEIPQVFAISQGLQTGSVPPLVTLKQEDGPIAISCTLRPAEDLLTSKDLQNLVGRAARRLGIEFPSSSNDDPPRPTMAPELEDLVQMTWSNPSSAEAFRPEFSDLYRLHEGQSQAYDRMPQVNDFMSAIFQVIQPAKDKELAARAELWKPTEDLVEKAYRSAAMLAKTANYLRYLSDYQKRLLAEVSQDTDPQKLTEFLRELNLVGHFASQLSSHQAELSGRVMAASVAVSRQVWMAKTNYGDSLKATVSDLPFVAGRSVGENGGSSSRDGTCRLET